MLKKTISYKESFHLLDSLSKNGEVAWRQERQRFFFSKDQKGFFFRPPALFPALDSKNEIKSLESYFQKVSLEKPSYALILIQAGSASLGIFDDEGELFLHKGIKKYMVRKKQGKSQLTYLRKKGKSRYGSRLRLQESMDFFEEINRKLSYWEEELERCEFWFYSAGVRLWNEIFLSKEKIFFKRDDHRLRSVPFDVKIPRYEELLRQNRLLSKGHIECLPDYEDFLSEILYSI